MTELITDASLITRLVLAHNIFQNSILPNTFLITFNDMLEIDLAVFKACYNNQQTPTFRDNAWTG